MHDTQLATALESGRYNALCGHLVAAAPMTEPDGEPCLLCEELRNRPVERPRARPPAPPALTDRSSGR